MLILEQVLLKRESEIKKRFMKNESFYSIISNNIKSKGWIIRV